jgi:hypothetical protein
MLFALVCFQYINTQRLLRNKARSLRANNDPTSTNNLSLTETSDPPVVDGDILVTFDPIKGYNLSNVNKTFSAPEISGGYLCGQGNVTFFAIQPQYTFRRAFSVSGMFLLFFLTIVITLALTGVWPMVYGMQNTLDLVLRVLLNGKDEFNEEIGPEIKKNKKVQFFAKIWLLLAAICLVVFAAITAHTLASFLGWATIIGVERDGWCYNIDSSQLPAPHTSSTRKLRAADNSSIPEVPVDFDTVRPQADVELQSNGDVTFITNCESSMYETTTGAIWDIVPQHDVECHPVDAHRVKRIASHWQQLCSGGDWGPSVEKGLLPGYTGVIEYTEDWNNQRCGFCNWGWRWIRGWTSYDISSEESWEFCNLAEQVPHLVRRNASGMEIIPFKQSITVDPRASRQYGWYTTGDQEVIPGSDFDEGRGKAIMFFTPGSWREYIEKYYATPNGNSATVHNIPGISTDTSRLQCRIMFTIKDGNRFEEFQEPCKSVRAQISDRNATQSSVTIISTDPLWCYVILGFTNNNLTYSASIKQGHGVTVRSADRWKCITDGDQGIDCGPHQPFHEFDPAIKEAVLRTTVTLVQDQKYQSDWGALIPGSISFPSIELFDTSTITEAITAVLIALAVIVVIVIVCFVVYKAWKKKQRGGPDVNVTLETPRTTTQGDTSVHL